MTTIFSADWLIALSSILLIDLAMSGDNAILIALVCKNLPAKYRFKAMIIGCAGAIIIRVIFTIFAVKILSIAFVQFLGGLLLLYIAANLLTAHKHQTKDNSPSTLSSAVRTIMIADLIMSIDNILSMAGVASTANADEWSLIICGILISLPIIICGANFFLIILQKFPVVIYAGGAVLAFTAAKMVTNDKMTAACLSPFKTHIEIIFVIAVLLWGIIKSYGISPQHK
ncbi:YjbE family putative metal transport protein [Pectinatus frisingensis]|jgi:YjbE family integral membrane protein|uniref:YjbE family putative metal transport protein n=1 Tax=Pectinatus frisingensis TaxID=865 RepID=UPI0015F49B54|nr:YjbE family putative metal transport protein [Pectinatus frisingensis]